ncbi:sigma-54 dependent transcriptional regulator [Azoarcus sp. KH32C]|uniref:sigma-54-dependent transcriptional regulator n=1 Tax=Azoarcus sp. KH32C TaxID=748247 RepID=UPI00023867CC|nr:sigma 54-interacting transcriptional regulator [Azoarcus sp. KH32C]BAL22614.1 two-component, sigma-54 specific, transcriptional regulator, Fis family [Azoarcus sp. KH32C]
MPRHTILVIPGDSLPGDDIVCRLQDSGWTALQAKALAEVRTRLATFRPEVVLADLDAWGTPAAASLERLAAFGTKLVLVGGDAAAVSEAIRAGAWYHLPALPEAELLEALLERACDARRMERTQAYLKTCEARATSAAALLGDSAPMQSTRIQMRRLLDAEAQSASGRLPAILISGENGSGKESVARALHMEGAQAGGPFVMLNCAAADDRLEAELFGEDGEGGSWPGGLVEAAEGGTLFLAEIGACTKALQARIVALIEGRRVSRDGADYEIAAPLRIVCSTSQSLDVLVRDGRFRPDLLRLLRANAIPVSPLRDRGEDVAILARHFLAHFARVYARPRMKFTAPSLAVLRGYRWPGNVSELSDMMEQTVLLARGDIITPNQLAICPGLSGSCERDFQTLDSYCMSVPSTGVNVADVEQDLVVKMLEKTDWNVTKSARLLGLTRDQLRYRIEKLGLMRPER